MSSVVVTPAIAGVGQIAVNVQDVERAVATYRDLLGLSFLFQVPGLAFFECGGVRLMLSRPESPEFDHASSVLYFRVGNLSGTYEALRARGLHFRDAPHKIADMSDHELWMAFFDDGEGNVHALMAELPRP